MKLKFLVAVALIGSLSACTSVVRGTKQKYPITSTPAGAKVVIRSVFATGDNKGKPVKPGREQTCVTPCFLKLKRGRDVAMTISKPGYQTQDVLVKSKVTGSGVGTMTAGNFLLGGGIGAIIDASNGSTRSLYPDHVDAVLVPGGAAPAPQAPTAEPAPAAETATPKGN